MSKEIIDQSLRNNFDTEILHNKQKKIQRYKQIHKIAFPW